jgi:hypothetical protein
MCLSSFSDVVYHLNTREKDHRAEEAHTSKYSQEWVNIPILPLTLTTLLGQLGVTLACFT